MGSAVRVALDMTLVGEHPLEGLLQRRAGDAVLAGDDAAGGSLIIGEGQQNQALIPVEPVPNGLMGVTGFVKRQFERRRRRVKVLRPLKQVVEVMGEQDRALRMPAGVGE